MTLPWLVSFFALCAAIVGILVLELLRFPRPYSLEWRQRRRRSLAEVIPWDYLADDGLIVCKDNRLLAAWEITAPDMSAASHGDYATHVARAHSAVVALDGSYTVTFETFREPITGYPGGGKASDPTIATMGWARRRRYDVTDRQFVSRSYVTLTFSPPKEFLGMLQRFASDEKPETLTDDELGERLAASIRSFSTALVNFEDSLSSTLRVRRLKSNVVEDGSRFGVVHDELLQLLHRCVTGEDQLVRRPPNPHVQKVLASEDVIGGLQPRVGDNEIVVLAIADFPDDSKPGSLDVVTDQTVSLRFHSRATIIDDEKALERMEKLRGKALTRGRGFFGMLAQRFGGADPNAYQNPAAASEAQGAIGAIGAISSGRVKGVLWDGAFILTGPDRKALLATARALRKAVKTAGFTCRIESVNALEAYIGALPGDVDHNVSDFHLDTLHVMDLAPLHHTSPGPTRHPNDMYEADAPPSMIFLGYGNVPVAFYPYTQENGHLVMVGPSGTAKSTFLLATLAGDHDQHGDTEYHLIDQGGSAERICVAADGAYYRLTPGAANARGFAPLRNIDDDEDMAAAESWLGFVFERNNVQMSAQRREIVWNSLKILRGSPLNERSLSHFQQVLKVFDRELASVIEFYTITGPLGRTLDEVEDRFGDVWLHVYEIKELLALKDPRIVEPVILHLLRSIARRITSNNKRGLRTRIVLEEANDYAADKLMAFEMRTLLDKIRKDNGTMWFVFQRAAAFAKSDLREAIFDTCKTRLFLPNPEATRTQADVYSGDDGFALPGMVCEMIASATPRRHVIIVQNGDCALVNMDVSPEELLFAGASSDTERKRTRSFVERYGRLAPYELLRDTGLDEAAAFWLKDAMDKGWLTTEEMDRVSVG